MAVKLALNSCTSNAGDNLRYLSWNYYIDKTRILETSRFATVVSEPVSEEVQQRCAAIQDFMALREQNRGDYIDLSTILKILCED